MAKKEEMSNVPNCPKKIPYVRFPEFIGGWEMKKLGNVMDFKVTNSFSRDNLNYETGYVKNIHYGDIHTRFQTLFDITKEKVPYINEEISISRISEDFYCKEGDVLFADASEDLNDVGKSIEIFNLNNEKILAGLHTILARPKTNYFKKGFLGYLFKSANVRLQIKKEAQGSKVLSISSGRISKIDLIFPRDGEQEKIVELLSRIDDRITVSIKIINNLQSQIEELAKQIFSQKTSFKDDGQISFPEWENKLGNEVFDSISNKNHNSDLPILAITQEHGAIPRDFIQYQVSVTDKSIESYKVVEVGDFIISLRSFQGGIEYSNYKGICSPAYIILRAKIDIDNRFYKYYLKTANYIKSLNEKLEGIRDGKMISYKYFCDIRLPYPSLNEQRKISDMFSIIEQKVNLEKDLLFRYETQKKYLLKNLFV